MLGFGELALLERGQEQKADEEEGPAELGSATLCLQPQVELFFHSGVSVSVKKKY